MHTMLAFCKGEVNKKILGSIQLIRPKQWIKNFFVFAPLLFSGEFVHIHSVQLSMIAFILFCIASSAVYVVNDITDIRFDKMHPEKSKKRPLASGVLSIYHALIILFVFYFIILASYNFYPSLIGILGLYILINVAYSFALKKQPIIDIFCIAIGFVLRIYAGAVILMVPITAWMFATTLALALYLAAIKRRQELLLQGDSNTREVLGKYTLPLINRYAEMSAIFAILFYSMFIVEMKPGMVITIPFVIFGFFRYWYLVESFQLGESPTEVVFFDWQLLLTILSWIGLCVWVLWPGVQ